MGYYNGNSLYNDGLSLYYFLYEINDIGEINDIINSNVINYLLMF